MTEASLHIGLAGWWKTNGRPIKVVDLFVHHLKRANPELHVTVSHMARADVLYDILLCSVFDNGVQVLRKYKAHVKIMFNGENAHRRYNLKQVAAHADIVFGYIDGIQPNPRCTLVRFPIWMYHWDFTKTPSADLNKLDASWDMGARKRSACFIAYNANHGRRSHMVKELRQIGLAVDCPGRVCNNMANVEKLTGISDKNQSKQAFLQRYVFNLCPENSITRGYVTEKVMQAAMNGCIPIYAGDAKLEPRVLNPQRILQCSSIQSIGTTVIQLKALLQDDAKLRAYFAQPIFLPSIAATIKRFRESFVTMVHDVLNTVTPTTLAPLRSLTHYWINVDACKKRAAALRTQFQSLHLPHRRVSAVTPLTLPALLKPNAATALKRMTPLRWACLCSHLKAIALALNETHDPWLLIVEDDMRFVHRVDWDALITSAPPDSNVLQLFSVQPKFYNHLEKIRQAEWLPWKETHWSTGVYLMKRTFAEQLLRQYVRQDGTHDFRSLTRPAVADIVIYLNKTYTYTYPVYVADSAWKSTITQDINPLHVRADRFCMRVLANETRYPRPACLTRTSFETIPTTIIKKGKEAHENAFCFYWINMKRGTARRKRMEQLFTERSLMHCRVEALDGKDADFMQHVKTSPRPWSPQHIRLRRFEIATTLSHLKAVYTFLKTNTTSPYAIICEDDLSFEYEKQWPKTLQQTLTHAPALWNVLQLGLTVNASEKWQAIVRAGKPYQPRKRFWWSAIAYAISRPYALRLLAKHNIDVSKPHFHCTLYGNVHSNESEKVVIGLGPAHYLVYPPRFTYPKNNTSFIHPQHAGLHTRSKGFIDAYYRHSKPPSSS